ncbi:hypothetical protein DW184_24170 [Enterobacter cloacae]|nr:hypothetical protein DW184_24170 [Enterobacter cloacae]
MTAWAAGLRHNIRKQNRPIIPVFNPLSVPMKFKSPVTGVFGSARRETGKGYDYRAMNIKPYHV